MNTNIPENLMNNVERRLRKHVNERKHKRYIYRAAAVIVVFLVIVPASAFAYSKYNDNILYKQSIDLARENNDITKVDKTFNYKGVSFNIKEIVADTTGIEVIYDVSDPKYSINEISFGDKDNKKFDIYSYMYSDSNPSSKERSFFIGLDSSQVEYVKNNPVSINIKSIAANNTSHEESISDKVKDFIYGKSKSTKLDWVLKTKVSMKQTKIIPVNKQYSLDIGTLKINSLRIGLFTTMFDYTFVPKDKSISMVDPMFSIRLGSEYVDGSMGESYSPGGGMVSLDKAIAQVKNGEEENGGFFGTRGFKSVYYKNQNQIGIRLVALNVEYNSNDSKVYKVDKNKFPMELNYNSEKFKITAVKENKDSTEYTIEYEKNNRVYNSISIDFDNQLAVNVPNNGTEEDFKRGKVQFADQTSKDKIYTSLVKKVPNLREIEKHVSDGKEVDPFLDANISSKITVKHKGTSSPTEFKIAGASKTLIYDEDEVIVINSSNN